MASPNPGRLFFMADELGGAGHWAETVALQLGRVREACRDLDRDATPAAYHRVRYETYFFLAAVRQLLRVSEAYLDHTKDQRLSEALDAFHKAVPDAVGFRNWAERLDEYFAGVAPAQIKGRVARDATFDIERAGDRVLLHFDGRKLNLAETEAAAQQLAAVASDVWMHHFHAALRPGPGVLRRD
jgi:hypothetical protein